MYVFPSETVNDILTEKLTQYYLLFCVKSWFTWPVFFYFYLLIKYF
jgi:hypothetical protein